MDKSFRVVTTDVAQFFAWLKEKQGEITNSIVVFDEQNSLLDKFRKPSADVFNIGVQTDRQIVVLADCPMAVWSSYQAQIRDMKLFPMAGSIRVFNVG